MYCRECGNQINDNAEICVKCGCRPLNSTEYCQVCGAKTTEKQVFCVKCGSMLKINIGKTKNIFENINNCVPSDNYVQNLNFSLLPPYYQKEFQKIYSSNESYKGKFNIWGFLFGAIWALTKGCWLSAVTAIVLSFFTAGVGGIVYWFIFGFRGTYMYYNYYVKDKQCIV